MFIAEVEVLRAQLYETDITVEGEFLSDEAMIEEGFSENLVGYSGPPYTEATSVFTCLNLCVIWNM